METNMKKPELVANVDGEAPSERSAPPPMNFNQRQLNKLETRRLLLDAGLELFVEHGFEQTHAIAIAQKAGVAVGTLYLHFGDKEGLLREILLQAARLLHERVSQVYQNPSPDPEMQARAHIEAMVQFIEENQQEARFMLSYALQRNPVSAGVIDSIVAQIEQSLRLGAECGVYRSDIDPALAARAEANMNLGLLSWWTEDPRRASRDQIIDTLTKFRASGLHIRPK
jgi:AcrR family transcriptional regulator